MNNKQQTINKEVFPLVSELSLAHVNSQPVNIDWSNRFNDDGEEMYKVYDACECGECGEMVISNGCGEEQHSNLDDESECEGYIHSDGPAMNYYYPLTGGLYGRFEGSEWRELTPEEVAENLLGTPLCLIEFEDEFALALTGGGMDLSWEICLAFMQNGWIPPFHFAHLPEMSGYGESEKHKWIIAGCKNAATHRAYQANSTYKHLEQFEKS